MELMAKMYIVGKINEWIRKRILEEEIVSKGKAGADKLQNILDEHVWDNIEKFIKSAKSKDNKFIPNFIEDFSEDIIEPLNIIGKAKGTTSQNYQDAMKLLNARVNNLESNLHIEIDMERIEDKSKALSYIGIEIADALKSIPTPVEEVEEQPVVENIEVAEPEKETPIQEIEQQQYNQEMTFEAKPSLWQRIKNSKIVRAVKAITRIRVVIDYSDALPEGRGENK